MPFISIYTRVLNKMFIIFKLINYNTLRRSFIFSGKEKENLA